MSWHNLAFKEVEMENLKLERLKSELKTLTEKYLNSSKQERDIIDLRVKKIKKQINDIKKDS